MKKALVLSGVLGLLAMAGFSANASRANAAVKIDPKLVPFAQSATQVTSWSQVVVLFSSDALNGVTPLRNHGDDVRAYLVDRTDQSLRAISDFLSAQGALNKSVKIKGSHWVNASFTASVTPAGLKVLAQAPGISKIYANAAVVNEVPVNTHFADSIPADSSTVPYDYKEIGLDRLIHDQPKVDGSGVTVGAIDTGIDGTHPALKGKIALYYDVLAANVPAVATDSDNHGTHTAGTMVGGDHTSNLIGMAPGAKIVEAGNAFSDFDLVLTAMQYLLNPGHNVAAPRVINNSWNCGGAPDVEMFYRAITTWDGAGIFPVFSAGNSGPGDATITEPHSHPAAFAVGSTSEDGKVSDFSSRGPGNFHGEKTQKPDITAPGSNIRSSFPGGIYGNDSGTSMAAPHVTGIVALLLQVNPALKSDQLRKLLIATAKPVDEDGAPTSAGNWNKNYGFGKLDAYAAVNAAKSLDLFYSQALDAEGADLTAALLSTPERLMLSSIYAAGLTDAPVDFGYPAALEGDTWVSASQIWR